MSSPGARPSTPRRDDAEGHGRVRLPQRVRRRFERRRGAPPEGPAAEPEVAWVDGRILRVSTPEFGDLASAHHLVHSAGDAGDDDERARLRAALPGMVAAFEAAHGRIVRSHLAGGLGAAVLTERNELAVVLGPEANAACGELLDLLRRCERIAYAAWHRLYLWDQRSCQLQVWGVVDDALRLLEDTPEELDDDGLRALRGGVKRLTARLDQAEDFMLRCAARRTQSHYVKWMLVGLAVIGGLLAAALQVLLAGGGVSDLARDLLLVALAGATGAVFSVLARMTSGSLQTNLPTLHHDMKGTDLHLLAALRPAVGAVFALALYVLVAGGIVPVEDGDGATRTSLLTGLAFLAGFSERLAQDVFIRSGQGLVGAMGDSPTRGPAAGLAPPPGGRR